MHAHPEESVAVFCLEAKRCGSALVEAGLQLLAIAKSRVGEAAAGVEYGVRRVNSVDM